jgi:hypothetical protein
MRGTALLNELVPRLQRLRLVDAATGFFDRDEVEAYIGFAIRYLANRYQLQHFLQMNRELLRTQPGVEIYGLPPNYGFWSPEETRRSGLAVREPDDETPTDLHYYDPARYELSRSRTPGKPAWFTLVSNSLYLMAIPDKVYVVEAIIRPLQHGYEIPDPYAQAVEIETLWRLAGDSVNNQDAQRALPVLDKERTEILRTMVNGEHRQRQRFYTSSERIGFGRGRRRYGR